jgi:D-xylose transport system substrate-binding protein
MTNQRARLLGAIGAAALLSLAACNAATEGTSGGGGSAGGDNFKVAFLMPDIASTRYELQDKPLFEAKLKQLCSGCSVVYLNAQADASKQQQQANSAFAQGVKAIVLDPVDSAAAATTVQAANQAKIPIIAYDRPIPKQKADFYVSFDNEKIGASIAQSLVDKLKKDNATGGVLQINGSPTDAAAGLIKKGVHSVVDGSGFKLLAEYDTPEWAPAKAQDWTAGQITKFSDQIAGVVAANDGTGGGAIAAFHAAGGKIPPVTGNDAELAAVQRVIAGDQYNTISKPIKIVAEAAAEVAYKFAKGEKPAGEATLFDTPSQLFTPTVVTQDNVKKEMFDSGLMKAGDVCTSAYKAQCDKLSIS